MQKPLRIKKNLRARPPNMARCRRVSATNNISKHFSFYFCILRSQYLWKIDQDLTLGHQCCSCIDLIARVMSNGLVILCNYCIDVEVPISSPNRFSNKIRLLILWMWKRLTAFISVVRIATSI